jgi:hypothetical protein
MIELDDSRWQGLEGGYRIPYDPSPALHDLEKGENAWDDLWENLHHQGDVGVASYAAVPHIVRIGRSLLQRDWNLYGLVSTIEIERHRKTNPPIPEWLKEEYEQAWQELLELGISDLRKTTDPLIVQSILGVISLAQGHLKLGALISNFDTSELDALLDDLLAWSELYDTE